MLGPTAIEALFSKSIDAVFIGPSPAINGYIKSKGEKFVVVAVRASGGAGLVMRKDVSVRDVMNFHGKIFATPQLANTQDIAARIFFLQSEATSSRRRAARLTIVPLANPDQLTMFHRKQIDGAWTVEPWLSRLEIEGGGQLVLDEKTLWPGGRYTTTLLS